MSRIAVLGAATQQIYFVDHDCSSGTKSTKHSVFSKIALGSDIHVDKAVYSVGGSGANAAVSFARYGHETILMGSLAHDVAGEAVLKCLDDENIDSSYIDFSSGTTSCTVILLDAGAGKRTILSYDGVSSRPSQSLQAEDLESIQPDWLYAASLDGDMETLLAFFEKAHQLKCKVMFNPGAAELAQPKKLIGLLEDVDVLLVNKAEAAQIVPGTILTELLSRLANYCKTVLITDGPMGAIATDHKKTYRLGIYEQSPVCDAIGAGDAFGAGFLAEYAETKKFKQALQFASANATMVMQAYGSQAGIMTGDEDLHPMPIMEVEDTAEWIKSK